MINVGNIDRVLCFVTGTVLLLAHAVSMESAL